MTASGRCVVAIALSLPLAAADKIYTFDDGTNGWNAINPAAIVSVTDERSFDGVGKSLMVAGKTDVLGVEAYPKIIDHDTRIIVVYYAEGVGNEMIVQGRSVQAKVNVHGVISPLVHGRWAVGQVRVATMTDWGNKVACTGHQLSFLQFYTTPAAGAVSRFLLARVAIVDGDDRTPPTAPSGASAAIADGAVTVSWRPAADNVCTANYRVHRGMTVDFTPSRENLVAESTAVAFVDATLGNFGTYYYRIIPIDVAGNVGAPSDAARVTATE
jgi:hypothetical protein